MERQVHGGDVYRNRVELDFSVNINPLGTPESVKRALYDAVDGCGRYPDLWQEALRGAIAETLGCPPSEILCGNGASELLSALVRAAEPKKIVIPVPSFFGYERAARAANAKLCFPALSEADGFAVSERLCEAIGADADLLFLANPNNPTGARIPEAALIRILEHCRERDVLVALDECFLDFVEGGVSMLARRYAFPNLAVVRAFTKLYAIPGVRLGYLVCADATFRGRVEAQLPEWNVSVFAERAGLAACRERTYRERTPGYVARERAFLQEGLANILEAGGYRFRLYPSEANFLLFFIDYPLGGALLSRGILIRDCAGYRGLSRGYYRIAVRSREENERLLEEIGRALLQGAGGKE